MSRVVSRAIPLASRSALRPNKPFRCFRPPPPPPSPSPAAILRRRILLPVSSFHADGGRVGAPRRSYGSLKGRASKRRQAVKPLKERELLLDVKICIEEDLPDDPEILRVAETLRVDVPVAMKVAFENLSDSRYKTRDTSIGGLGGFEKVELSVMLCNDDFIQKLNKEWRDEDRATDVLSMSQHIPELDIPILILGDVVISVETAARQAEERGHTLLDEIRILMVHGLLHLLGFDHEISDEAEAEMENEEERVLKSLGWTGKGLIKSAYDGVTEGSIQTEISDDEFLKDGKKQGNLRFHKPKFSFTFCDLDGTLLNSKSQITPRNAKALKEAISRGVTVVIATGKTRPGAISALQMVDFTGKDGIVSKYSPGVFLQPQEAYRKLLNIHHHSLQSKKKRNPFGFSLIWFSSRIQEYMIYGSASSSSCNWSMREDNS